MLNQAGFLETWNLIKKDYCLMQAGLTRTQQIGVLILLAALLGLFVYRSCKRGGYSTGGLRVEKSISRLELAETAPPPGCFLRRSVETVSIIFKINQSVPVVYSYAQHPEHCKP